MHDVVVPEHWQAFYEATRIPAAAVSGRRVHVTGHTGEEPDGSFASDPTDQIRRTFTVVGETLRAAGASWADVVEIRSYHVGYRDQAEAVIAVAGEFLVEPYPAWTAVGVTELFEEEAVVEISCVAER